MYKKLEKCLKSIREKTDFKPEKAVILGSGLGDYAEKIKIEKIVKYTEIEGFPVSTVQGHKGQFVFGYVKDVPVVLMQGRVHYYEGYSMQDVVLPTRLMGMMGAKKVLLTNAAGGVNPSFRPGDFMLITDHITTAVPSPLIGPNIEELGTRFPDMSEVYSKKLQDIIRKSAKDCGIPLQEGVYVQLTGPNYETPAEIRMVRSWGADAVGMSTACEAMAKAVKDRFGTIDVLINNAGIADYDLINVITPARWHRLFAVNVDGAFYCIRAALPHMLQQQSGCIINVSSMWGQVGASCEAAYSATKGAILALTKALAQELGPSGIRVNAVAPGVIRTDMCASVDPAVMEDLRQQTPIGRLGTPEDIAQAMLYLADAPFLTGQTLPLNGGFVIT